MIKERKTWGARVLIGVVMIYMGILIIAPLVGLVTGVFERGLQPVFLTLTSPLLHQSLSLSLQIALVVVVVQTIFGTLIAWVLVRQDFRFKTVLNGFIDIPFAISGVVVGYMLLLLFGRQGLLFPLVDWLNFRVAFAVPGMFLATLFVCLPFMVREMIPVFENLDRQQEKAAATLGANTWLRFWRVIFPQMKTALIYGITLTFARAMGEFGSVLVIGGGIRGRTETATVFIFRSLDERRFVDAYVAALILGFLSVLIVLVADGIKKAREKKES